ncbi:MAG: HEAT repeat domain-containing protein [Myxococcota bacterium]|nr:HEAT repeat domain-containing protein [Myxococcota bacterium]
MLSIRTHSLLLISFLALTSTPAVAKKKTGTKATAQKTHETIRLALEELGESADSEVRMNVFVARMELSGKDVDRAIMKGMAERDADIRDAAVLAGLRSRTKKIKKAADKVLKALLESAGEDDRLRGRSLLEKGIKSTDRAKWMKSASKVGSKDARQAARKNLIASGGKAAWKVIQAGLAEKEGEPEHQEALKALQTFRHPAALNWAMGKIYDKTQLGSLARDYLAEVDLGRGTKKFENKMKASHRKHQGQFDKELPLAYILGVRGHGTLVKESLLGTFNPRYTPKSGERLMAWKGMRKVRDTNLLTRTLSQKFKLKFKALLMSIDEQAEVDAAFAWLEEWAKANNEPEVYKLLIECAQSELTKVRIAAMATLGRLGHRKSQRSFIAAMSEGRAEIRRAAALGIGLLARRGDEKLIGQLLRREPDVEAKLAFVDGLARIGTPEIINYLQFLIQSPKLELKKRAARAIAAVGGNRATVLLRLLRNDRDLELRFTVWTALLKTSPKEYVSEFSRSAVSWLTPEQLRLLSKNASLPLDILMHLATRGQKEQRAAAVEELKMRGNQASTRLLTVFETSDDEATVKASISALASIRGAKSIPTYRAAIKHRFGMVRAEGYNALRQHASKALLETVLAGLNEKSPLARVQAARAAIALSKKR